MSRNNSYTPQHEDSLIDISPPSTGSSTPATQSASSSLFGSVISGIWGRLSSSDTTHQSSSWAQQPHSNANQLSSSMHSATFPSYHPSSHGDGIHGAFTPPHRHASPRGLPSLEPLVLTGYRDDTEAEERLLSKGIAEEIRTFLPERLKIGEEWRLVYSLYQHGSSLSTLYKLCDEYRGRRVGFVLVVRDGMGGVSTTILFFLRLRAIGHIYVGERANLM